MARGEIRAGRRALGSPAPPGAFATSETLDELAAGEPEEADEKPSPREEDADRAFRSAIWGFIIPPLHFLALILLYQVYQSPGRLEGKYRTYYRATLAIYGTILGLVVLIILIPKGFFQKDELREMDHPEILVGLWELQDGKNQITWDLKSNGEFIYRDPAGPVKGIGSWAFADDGFYLRIRHYDQGEWIRPKVKYFFSREENKKDELILKVRAKELIRLIRR